MHVLYFKEVLVQMEKSGQPIIIIDPRKEQTKGRDALSMNIAAAKAVATGEPVARMRAARPLPRAPRPAPRREWQSSGTCVLLPVSRAAGASVVRPPRPGRITHLIAPAARVDPERQLPTSPPPGAIGPTPASDTPASSRCTQRRPPRPAPRRRSRASCADVRAGHEHDRQ